MPTRRAVVSCAAHLALAAAVAPRALRAAWARAPRGRVVAREPFGTLERVADGVWALVSTPFGGDRTTLSNGGIVAGRSGVLAVEGFNQAGGARWLAGRARELTGRWPTHVVVTHYHGDHANGVAGYLPGGSPADGSPADGSPADGSPADGERLTVRPAVRATAATRDLVLARNRPAGGGASAADSALARARDAALADAELLGPNGPTAIDLGGRVARVVPRAGHTASDASVELDEPGVVFCGDLVWNGMFPNYVDALPSRLGASVRALGALGSPGSLGSSGRPRDVVYVPGHGAVAGRADFDRYVALLDEVERAARLAHGRGVPAAEGAASFALPASLGEWALFNRAFFERAFAAWGRELGGG